MNPLRNRVGNASYDVELRSQDIARNSYLAEQYGVVFHTFCSMSYSQYEETLIITTCTSSPPVINSVAASTVSTISSSPGPNGPTVVNGADSNSN